MLSRLKVRTKLVVILIPALVALVGLAAAGILERLDDRRAWDDAVVALEVGRLSAGATTVVEYEQLAAMALDHEVGGSVDLYARRQSDTDAALTALQAEWSVFDSEQFSAIEERCPPCPSGDRHARSGANRL